MRNIGKSTGPLEWWAPPFFFTSETPDVPARPKNVSARETAPPAGCPVLFQQHTPGNDSWRHRYEFPDI